MPFSPSVRQEVLVRSKRHCCVCQEFAGRDVNVHHIEPEAAGGSNLIENAILVCARCHSEAGHYNSNHPLGTRYSAAELVRHRDEWWKWCAANPATMPPKSPISITPASVPVVASEWTSKYEVSVYNRHTAPLFQIWIKVTLLGSIEFGRDVEVLPSVSADAIPVSAGNLTLSGRIVGLMGQDALRRPSILLRLYGLDAGRSAHVKVVHKAAGQSNVSEASSQFEIVDFAESPRPVLEKADGTGVAIPFEMPIAGFTIQATFIHIVTANQ